MIKAIAYSCVRRPLLCALAPALAAAVALVAGESVVRFVTFGEVRRLVSASGSAAHEGLSGLSASQREENWAAWVQRRHAELRGRVMRADEDSLAYLLVFGTSFTRAPRFTRAFMEESSRTPPASTLPAPGAGAAQQVLEKAFDRRLADLMQALGTPGTDERLLGARATLDRLGYRVDTAAERTRTHRYLLDNLARVTQESDAIGEKLRASEALGDKRTELAQRARLFSGRGLASDSSWPINFAVAESLRDLASRAALAPRSVSHVAIVGPGLDFIDKDEGHDFYPPQSLQPFALIDALLGTGLSETKALTVTTLDFSPRVNSHIEALRIRAATRPYDLQLIRRHDVNWTSPAKAYFAAFGANIGQSVPGVQPPGTAGLLDFRAVRVAPEWLRRLRAVDMDTVYQRLDLDQHGLCDLVVATNVLLYYDLFDQALAVASLSHILRPGAVLITNTRLDDLPAFPLRRISESAHAFSDRPGDGEYIFAYRK